MKGYLFVILSLSLLFASCGKKDIDTRTYYYCALVNGSSHPVEIEMTTYEPRVATQIVLVCGDSFHWEFLGGIPPVPLNFIGEPQIKVTFGNARRIIYTRESQGRNPMYWQYYVMKTKHLACGAVYTLTDADYEAGEAI